MRAKSGQSSSESECDSPFECESPFDCAGAGAPLELPALALSVASIAKVECDGRVLVGAVDLVRSLTGGNESAARKHLQRLMSKHDLGVESERTGRGGKPRLVCDAKSAASVVLVSPCSASMDERMRFAGELSRAMGGTDLMRAAEKIIATIPDAARDFLGPRATPADLVALAPAALMVEETAARFDDVRSALRDMRDTHVACERRARLELDGVYARLDALEYQLRLLHA